MTERFTLDDEIIFDNNSIADDGGRKLYWTFEYVQRQKLVDLLNELHEENVILKKIIDEDDVLIKSLLSAYYNEKWEDFCKNYGVDFDE